MRRPASRPASAALRLVVLSMVLAVGASACVLQHPVDNATPAAQAWYKAHTKDIDLLVHDVGTIRDPAPLVMIDDLETACKALQTDATRMETSVPAVPNRVLQGHWKSALEYFVRAGNVCLLSINRDPVTADQSNGAWLQIRLRRSDAMSDLAFGTVRLRTLIGAFGGSTTWLAPVITPTTLAAPPTTAKR